jgi:CBS domain-containing protein
MTTTVESCLPTETAKQVARRMTEKNVSSILVIDAGRKPIGIITARDLVDKVIAPENADGRTLTAREIMSSHSYAMSPATYMYEALAYMTGHRIKHLPVVDRGEVVGIVTLRDIMRYRSQKAMLLLGNIREERTIEGIVTIRREILGVARRHAAHRKSWRSSPTSTTASSGGCMNSAWKRWPPRGGFYPTSATVFSSWAAVVAGRCCSAPTRTTVSYSRTSLTQKC